MKKVLFTFLSIIYLIFGNFYMVYAAVPSFSEVVSKLNTDN